NRAAKPSGKEKDSGLSPFLLTGKKEKDAAGICRRRHYYLWERGDCALCLILLIAGQIHHQGFMAGVWEEHVEYIAGMQLQGAGTLAGVAGKIIAVLCLRSITSCTLCSLSKRRERMEAEPGGVRSNSSIAS